VNVDRIFQEFNDSRAEYLLIGGMNFAIRHQPILTFDVDLFVRHSPANLNRCEMALSALGAEWGRTDEQWEPVSKKEPGWLKGQAIFCLASLHGAIDIFLEVPGLPAWEDVRERSKALATASGITFLSISDFDMLACQEALPIQYQKIDRIQYLRSRMKQ
jgi:hypothetical protein